MTKTTSFVIIPVLLVAALLAAVILPGMAAHTPEINVSLPAAQAAAVPADELEFDGFVLSTKHQNSEKVIKGLLGMQGVRTNVSSFEFKPGSIQIWGGLHPRKAGWATVSVVWANDQNIWYAALEAPLSTGAVPSAIRIAPEAFINSADLKWSAAWIMSKTTRGPERFVDNEAEYLSLGEGWPRWLELKQRWGLNYLIEVIPFLPPPPGGN